MTELRAAIDALDASLVSLLDSRMELVLKVRTAKEADGGDDAGMYRIEREEEILQRLRQHAEVLTEAEVRTIFREILSCSYRRQEQQQIAYLGPPGTFSQLAVQRLFGQEAETFSCNSIHEVAQAVTSGHSRHGILPLENSTRGFVDESLDLLASSELVVGGEVMVPVRHCLMGTGKDWRKAKKIYSHPQSFAQCRAWLQKHLPTMPCEPVLSNAQAAERAAAETGTLAIAPELAADIYDLQVLQRDIQDAEDNTTRFVLIGKRQVPPSGLKDKTSLLLTTEDRPGALLELLQIFDHHQINMTMLYSRPSGIGKWSYRFFLDVDGHRQSSPLSDALKELEELGNLLKIIGSYPVASG